MHQFPKVAQRLIRKKTNIHILVCLQFLQTRHNLLLYQLQPCRTRSVVRILWSQTSQGSFGGKLSENADKNAVGFCDVEADVRNGVVNELVDHGQNIFLDDRDIDSGSKSLVAPLVWTKLLLNGLRGHTVIAAQVVMRYK